MPLFFNRGAASQEEEVVDDNDNEGSAAFTDFTSLHGSSANTHPMEELKRPPIAAAADGGGTPSIFSGHESIAQRSFISSYTNNTKKIQEKVWVHDINKHQLMIKHLYRTCRRNNWFDDSRRGSVIALRTGDGSYMLYPPTTSTCDQEFEQAVCGLNVEIAMIIKSDVVRVIMSNIPHTVTDVPLQDDTRIQILDTLGDLGRARKHQYAAFVREEKALIVWADAANRIESYAMELERKIIELIWDDGDNVKKYEVVGKMMEEANEVNLDVESGWVPPRRERVLIQPLLVAGSWIFIFFFIGSGLQVILREIAVDGNWARICLLFTTPMLFFAMFFSIVVVSYVFYVFGPSSQAFGNSMFYSGKPPERRLTGALPHITVQCPVYKESLAGVIDPTIQSIKAAISTYELQGGTSNIFINDDGMQLLDPEMAELRQRYYRNNNIGWVARPAHKKDGFLRAGRFKKASNMNFALNLSYRVEERLTMLERGQSWSDFDEEQAYQDILKEVVKSDGRAWADGDIRIGEIVLIIDSDTRVPEDCFLDAATEFHESPDLAILQHKSGVMQVVHNYWENGITYFTNLIYCSIAYAVSAGDTGPFVGWSALQEMMTVQDGELKWWSESHVSEDFEMSLKLQNARYIVRFATYCGDGFKEGVSLTVYDELARWEKYAYGCAELMFHPFKFWIVRGPFTKLFISFLSSKFTILGYVGTYYAIGSSWIYVTANYFIEGWYRQQVDQYYMDSFSIFLAVFFVFTVAGPFFNAVLKYRCKFDTFGHALIENYLWTLFFIIFFGGISMHVSKALLCYLFSIDMQWGATAKELEASNFWIEMPKIVKSFKYMYIFVIFAIAVMLTLAYAVPQAWRITGFFPTVTLGIWWSPYLPELTKKESCCRPISSSRLLSTRNS